MKTKTKVITFLILFIIVAWIAKSVYSYYFIPGYFDEFTKCLTDKGAVMYGAMEWCHYTQEQRAMFGKSFKYLNYKDYSLFPKDQGNIRVTPTWIINGQPYERVQSFERLSQLTGCELPK